MTAPLARPAVLARRRAGHRPGRHDRTARRARLSPRSNPCVSSGASEQMREFGKNLGRRALPARHRRRRTEARPRRARDGRPVEPRPASRRRARTGGPRRAGDARQHGARHRRYCSTPSRARSRRSTISTGSRQLADRFNRAAELARESRDARRLPQPLRGSSAPTSTAAPGSRSSTSCASPTWSQRSTSTGPRSAVAIPWISSARSAIASRCST